MKVRKTEAELRELARGISESIVIRNGGTDERRLASGLESDCIFKVAYGALLSLNWCSMREWMADEKAKSIMDTAEFILCRFIEDCNGFDTIFRPLNDMWFDKWEDQNEA